MAEPSDQDVVDRLERLDAGSAVPDLTAAEVRRLGDRRRRRTVAAVGVGAAVAVVAAATPLALLTGSGGDDGTVEPAGPAPLTSIPDGFPIDAGLAGPGRGVGVDGPVDALRSWATPPTLCGADVWPVEGDGALSYAEAGGEYYRGRVLVTYGSVAEAAAVVDDVRSALAACPTSDGSDPGTYVNTEIPPTTDDDSVTWSVTAESGRPGGSIHQFVRVGTAVLATIDSGEWTSASANEGATVLTYDNLGVVDAMATFEPDRG